MIKVKQAAVVVVLGHVCSGCAAETWDFETESLRINLAEEFTGTLCQGDLEALQGHVDRTASLLEVGIGTKVEVHLWPGFAVPEEVCGIPGAFGCHRAGVVHSSNIALTHELVHAVGWQAGGESADPFLEEGMAEALSGRAIRAPTVLHPFEALKGRRDPTTREIGAHFVRWALETYGAEGLLSARGLEAGPGFEAWTGLRLETAEQEYLDSSVFAYPNIWGCEPSVQLEDGVLQLDLQLACDAGETRAYGSSTLERCETVYLEAEGVYELRASSAKLLISRCLSEPEPDPVDTTISPTVPTDYHVQGAFPVLPGGSAFLELSEGVYELCLQSSSLEDTVATGVLEWTGYDSLP